jgi:HK97 family phage major capsid protein/HK97 family phage prohead protease
MAEIQTRLKQGATLPVMHRTAELRADDIEERSVDLVFSTEAPVERHFGEEVLVHGKNTARMTRINTSAPLLWNHDPNEQIGVVEHAKIDGNQGRARVRFSASTKGEEFFQDVKDGIRKLVSFGYRIHKTEVEQRDNQLDMVRVTDWEPFEISLVSIPADIAAGVGRGQNTDQALYAVEVAVRDADVVEAVADDAGANNKRTPIKIMSEPTPDPAPNFDADAERKKAKQNAWDELRAYDNEATAIKERAKHTQLKPEIVDKLISQHRENGDKEALGRAVLAALGDTSNIDVVKPVALGNTEAKRYSMTKLIRQMASTSEQVDGIELEMHQECLRTSASSIQPQGFMVPLQFGTSHTGSRALSVGAEGAETVATDIGSLVELWRDRMVLSQLGMTMLSGLSGNVQLPTHTATAAGAWDAEADTLSEASQTLGTVTLSPKRAGVTTKYSKQLLIQSSLDVENFVRSDQSNNLAVMIDTAGIEGSGASDQPQGVVNFAAANSLTFGGAATYTDYVNAWRQVLDAKPAFGAQVAFLITPAALEKGLTIPKVASTDSLMIIREQSVSPLSPFSVMGAPVVYRTGITGDKLICGVWSELVMGMFGNGFDVVVDPYTSKTSAQVEVTTNVFLDFAGLHEAAFTVSADSAAQ